MENAINNFAERRLEKPDSREAAVTIVPEEKLSLDQLMAISKKHDVMYTPHVGNKWREDLYISDAGIHTATFERNASDLDGIDMPHMLRVGGRIHELASARGQARATLTPYLELAETLNPQVQAFVDSMSAKNPGQLHHSSTLQALKGRDVVTSGESLIVGSENELTRDFLSALHAYSLRNPKDELVRIMTRYISPNGELLLASKEGNPYIFDGGYHYKDPNLTVDRSTEADLVKMPEQFFDLSQKMVDAVVKGEKMEMAEGPIPSNYLMVLLLALKPLLRDLQDGNGKLDLDEKGAYHAYAVSGPSMIKYTASKDFKKNTAALYKALRSIGKEQFGLDMPANLILHMIPGASLSYLPVIGENQAIDALNRLAHVDAEYRSQQETLSLVKGEKPSKALLDKLSSVRTKHKDAIKDLVDACAPLPHVSQYDLLAGKQLLSATQLEGVGPIPFKEHIKIAALIEEVRLQLSRKITT